MTVDVLSAFRQRIVLAVCGLLALVLVSGCGSVGTVTPPVPKAAPGTGVQAPVATGPGPAAVPPLVPVQQQDTMPGRILYVRDGNLWLWQAGNSRQFSEGNTWFQPAFSRDGTQVAYVYWTFNFSDLFVMGSDGSAPQRLTKGQSASLPDNIWALRPAWSPDSSRLAYVSDANSQMPQVWVMAKDGTNRKQLTSEATGIVWADVLSWDPNASQIAMTAAPTMRDPSQIYLLNLSTGIPEKLTNHGNGALDPAFSPDGSALAYIGRPNVQTELWIRSLDGTRTAHTDKLSNVRSPAWSPDGKLLAVMSPVNGAFEIFILSVKPTATGFEIGEPRQLTRDGAVDPTSGLTWAP
jgi:TolB protein